MPLESGPGHSRAGSHVFKLYLVELVANRLSIQVRKRKHLLTQLALSCPEQLPRTVSPCVVTDSSARLPFCRKTQHMWRGVTMDHVFFDYSFSPTCAKRLLESDPQTSFAYAINRFVILGLEFISSRYSWPVDAQSSIKKKIVFKFYFLFL